MVKPLFAPWRSSYSESDGALKKPDCPSESCPFCISLKQSNDDESFILGRFEFNAIFLNRYPYNAGHLLIIPYQHSGDLSALSVLVQHELIVLTSHCTNILKTVLGAEGINVGLNLGRVAGAGIPSHLHLHVLPRWLSDTNFLPVFGETKQIAYDLTAIYQKLVPAIHALRSLYI